MRLVAALLVLVAVTSACSSTPDGRVVLAESMGAQLAEQIRAPLAGAAGDPAAGAVDQVGELLVSAIHDLALPEDVEDLIPGLHRQAGWDGEGFGYVGTAIAVFRYSEPDFCMVVAVASDGQVEARPVLAEPAEMCDGAEIPDLLALTS
jgi:hypothetical protein